MVAASTSSMTAMHLLLDTGARVDSGDYEGRTPLMHAACAEGEAAYSNPVAVAFPITRGANVNAQDLKGRTPLMMAATVEDDAAGTLGSLRTARLLLAAKARTDLRDRNGDTALTLAVRHHNQGIVALLRNLAQKKPTRNSPKVIRKPVRR
jgi:ankyrin repeat protein